MNKLNQVMLSNNVVLTKEEIRRLVTLSQGDTANYGDNGSTIGEGITSQIDYVQLSKNLGLHKNALNLMQGSNTKIRN